MNVQFQCPESSQKLNVSAARWTTDSGTIYPVIDGIPWVVKRPDHLLAEWQTLTQQTLNDLKASSTLAEHALTVAEADLTRKKIQKLATSYADQATIVENLLKPMSTSPLAAPVSQALQKILPSTQKLLSYSANIFRDWNWGAEENAKTLELVREVLPEAKGTFIFLGCGAGRFLYDVHQHYKPTESVGIDINPLLLGIAQKMFKGGELTLYEFPMLPISSDKAAILRTLKAPAKLSGSVQLLLADMAALPLADAQADVIFTPWLIDILPFDTTEVMHTIHRLLKPGGTWVQLGPLGFKRRDPNANLCIDELVALANQNGFKVGAVQTKFLPYNQSPIDSHHRVELVSAFSARRDESVFPRQALSNLPGWLEDPTVPIPKLQSIEASLFVHRLYAEVLGLVDGKNTIESIALTLNTNFHLDAEQALGVTRRFFRSAWEAELWD